MKTNEMTKEILVDLYVSKRKRAREIAFLFNCGTTTVFRKLHQYGIAVRRRANGKARDFDAFIDFSGAAAGSTCWEWIGDRSQYGYGRRGHLENGKLKSEAAHRLAYERAFGPIPEGLAVCHRCDNRACVRPEHLFLGTWKDNSEDMVRKGRSNKGERHGNSKLTEEQVREIRRLYIPRDPERGATPLARRFGVTVGAIDDVARGVIWKHVDVQGVNAPRRQSEHGVGVEFRPEKPRPYRVRARFKGKVYWVGSFLTAEAARAARRAWLAARLQAVE
jgi:hypothetical protein